MKEKLRKIWKKLGPGLITGCSDDDPSGIATYTQAGAKFGLSLLWTALITYPLMYGIQETCARIGIASGKGIGGVIKKYYSKYLLYLLIITVFPAVTFNIAADLAGMGAVANLLFPHISGFVFACFFSFVILSTLFFCSYSRIAFILKWLCLALVAYIIVPFLTTQNWTEILKATFLPQIKFDKDFLIIFVAILGTTISPYLFFWQADIIVEEQNHQFIQNKVNDAENMKTDVNIGMFMSNIVMYFIILTAGTVLFQAGITKIDTVEQAAQALRPLAGESAYLLFAIGVIGTGLLAIPVLAGCLGFLFADAFSWERDLDKKPNEAPGFYLVLFISVAVALLFNLFGLDPIKSLIYSAVIYGILAPFLIALILHIANSKRIMGKLPNTWFSNALGIATLLLMSFAAITLLFTL